MRRQKIRARTDISFENGIDERGLPDSRCEDRKATDDAGSGLVDEGMDVG
jgi:hypothetical protein